METVLVQINNNKAYKLLADLEDLQIIKVLQKNTEPSQKLSEKYAGILPADVAEELHNYVGTKANTMASYKGILTADEAKQLQQYVTQSREEWKDNI